MCLYKPTTEINIVYFYYVYFLDLISVYSHKSFGIKKLIVVCGNMQLVSNIIGGLSVLVYDELWGWVGSLVVGVDLAFHY